MKNKLTLIILLVPLICISQTDLQQAIKFSHSRNYEQAEAILSKISANDSEAALARAYNFSWWGKYHEAEQSFHTLISNDENAAAEIGLAYNYLFAGDLQKAMHKFKAIESQSTKDKNALVGLVHTYLEKEQFGLARMNAERLIAEHPDDPESHFLLGLVRIKNQQFKEAETAFKNALALDHTYESASTQLAAIPSYEHSWELAPWLGYSNMEESDIFGLRRLDVFYRPTKSNLLFAYYDNSIRFENQFYASNGINSPQLGTGLSHRWNKKWSSTLIAGDRLVEDENNDYYFRLEQNYFPTDKLRLQGGLQYDNVAERGLNLYSFSLENKFSEVFSLEITYFYSDQLEFPDTAADRILLIPKIKFKNDLKLDVGYYSHLFENPEGVSDRFEGFFGLISMPLSKYLSGRILFHHQEQMQSKLNSAALGISIKL